MFRPNFLDMTNKKNKGGGKSSSPTKSTPKKAPIEVDGTSCGGETQNLIEMNELPCNVIDDPKTMIEQYVQGLIKDLKESYDNKLKQMKTDMDQITVELNELKSHFNLKVNEEVEKAMKGHKESAKLDKEKVNELVKTTAKLEDSYNFMSTETTTIKNKIDNDIGSRLTQHEKKVGMLKSRADDAEDRQRRWNVRIYDVPEDNDEICEERVKKMFEYLVSECKIPIDRAHRLGAPDSKRNRPIIVKLTYFQHKKLLITRAKEKKAERVIQFGIGEDYSKETFDVRRKLMAHLNAAKEINRTIIGGHINYRTLVIKFEIDNQIYTAKKTLKDISEHPSTWYTL